ncbi:MAG: EI24 domain-containing protein, partial [Planctomycetota bacterium]
MEGPQPLAPATIDRAELARRALVPIVPNAAPRCPRCGNKLLTPDTKSCSRCLVDPSSAAAAAMLVPEGSPTREFFRGAAYVPRGFVAILSRPKLWPVAALPFLLNIVIFVLVTYAGIFLIKTFSMQYSDAKALSDWTGWWAIAAYIVKFLAYISYYLGFVMVPLLTAWAMSAFPFSIVLRAIFMPFATILGERTEQFILDLPQAKEPFNFAALQASIVISIVDTLLLALLQAVLYVILIPLALIPPIWMILPPAIMAGMDHTDPVYCRKNYYMRERVALWKARKWRFLGFGVT